MSKQEIFIKGAREHNLKGFDVRIPRDKLCVVTGLSGSGKSSLAFDTIYAEGQRRYVESLSSYARQFIEQLEKPSIEYAEGLSPTISIEQRSGGKNPRSTVGTQTEIYDYLRVLFAKIGVQHCPKCGKEVSSQSSQQIVDKILELPRKTKVLLLAPLIKGRKGEHLDAMKKARKEGFIRLRIDGEIVDISDRVPELEKNYKHVIEVVADRLVVDKKNRNRISDSTEIALKIGSGSMIVAVLSPEMDHERDIFFSEENTCTECGISFNELVPRNFSFNSPYGACPVCNGLGNKMEIDTDLVVPDGDEPLIRAIAPWKRGGKGIILHYRRKLRGLARCRGFDYEKKFKQLTKKQKGWVLFGDEECGYEGVVPNLERRFLTTDSDYIKEIITKFMTPQPCPRCKGQRLSEQSRHVIIKGRNIAEVCEMSIKEAKRFFAELKLSAVEKKIAQEVLKEINARLSFMINVGLDYLTLSRRSKTLSGGEDQRIRLATQIGAGLVGVLYVLDEPSIGLHQKDNEKLLGTLIKLRDLGNTLLVVEHDEATIRKADHIIDLGPGAGEHGGEIVAQGGLEDILKSSGSLTGKYLSRELTIEIPQRRDYKKKRSLRIIGAEEHNLKNIDVKIPLGVFNCITGVSGSGKSTLVEETLYRALAKRLYGSKLRPGKHGRIKGVDNIDKVIVVDQSPIGRTPRSNPATYTGAFDPIRKLYSSLPESRMRGYKPGRFSFNVKGGRCEACRGEGVKKIEMHFLPDVYVTCEVCGGARFNDQTLQVKFKGYNISDVLKMSVKEALAIFKNITPVKSKLETLNEVGLGYIRLGQPATTLSGGEAQRVKLSTELSKRATGRTLYILDEPTTGLHFADISKLLDVLHKLVSQGNTVLVIEHNLDVIKSSDHVIDLGPEGGDEGGQLIASGSPEELARSKGSYTGVFLKEVLREQGGCAK